MPRLVVSSQFFLDLTRWDDLRVFLRDHVSPQSTIRAWSAGCHAGKEVYSLLILLDELGLRNRLYFLATDIDRAQLQKAAAGGPYSDQDVVQLRPNQRRYLRAGGPPHYVIDELRSCVEFRLHDIGQELPPHDFSVILYRDVEPFFTPSQNREHYAKFLRALLPGGVIFHGATDSAPGWRELGYRRLAPGLLQKPLRAARPTGR